MRLQAAAGAWAILAAAALASEPSAGRSTDIQALKDFAESLGLNRTRNFERITDKAAAAYRCYYTGKLELPASYDELRFEKGSTSGCRIDQRKYDVFFYPMHAVASGSTPVTTSLADSSPERRLMVVSHEDSHQLESAHLSSPATEAASTLIGFITAAEFARLRFGESSEVYKNLAGDVNLFLNKALLINEYQPRISRLYETFRSGSLSRESALERKRQLFGELEQACRAIPGSPATFNKCPAALNNAGLAFDYTYTKHYPLLHRLFVARRRDLRSTLAALQDILKLPLKTEEQLIAATIAAISEYTPPEP
jgi:hypothetical protein